jgi:hypothetical protein
MHDMSENRRDEALRLTIEARFDLRLPPDIGIFKNVWIADDEKIMRLIALARVGWIEIDHAAKLSARYINDETFKERVKSMLAAAPKPGEGE